MDIIDKLVIGNSSNWINSYKSFNKSTPIIIIRCLSESVLLFRWKNYDQLVEYIISYVIYQVNTYYSKKIYKRSGLLNFLSDSTKVRFDLFIGSRVYSDRELLFIDSSIHSSLNTWRIRNNLPLCQSELYILGFDRLKYYIK